MIWIALIYIYTTTARFWVLLGLFASDIAPAHLAEGAADEIRGEENIVAYGYLNL